MYNFFWIRSNCKTSNPKSFASIFLISTILLIRGILCGSPNNMPKTTPATFWNPVAGSVRLASQAFLPMWVSMPLCIESQGGKKRAKTYCPHIELFKLIEINQLFIELKFILRNLKFPTSFCNKKKKMENCFFEIFKN